MSCSVLPQISESFRRFGVSDSTKDLLDIKVGRPPEITHETVQQHFEAVIEGTPVEFSDEVLQQIVDLSRVRKVYKLDNNAGLGKKGKTRTSEKASVVNGDHEAEALEMAVMGMIALRGAS